MKDLFFGIDCSTQSITGIVIDFNSSKIVYKNSVNFDKDLPQYKTQNGVMFLKDEREVHSNPLMWIEALELLLEQLIKDNVSIEQVKAISGSGQQHGTVYLNEKFEKSLQNLRTEESLIKQLRNTFTRDTSPIWMDSSTSTQCKEIRDALGGLKKTIEITGSNTFERFSGPQIRKFYQEQLLEYQKTSIIHLVSSFMASILIGKNAPIDRGDGAGMNLMNIKTKQWDKQALKATAPNLRNKLPLLANSSDIIGKISPYFVKKYKCNPDTIVIAFSGDNPNSLIGVGITEKGKAAISLGTSDTYFGYLKKLFLDYNGEGHVFGAPTGDYMSLICYKNGSLAREKIKDQYRLDWDKFSDLLNKTPAGNYGKIMLPYFSPEIVPLVLEPKVYRFGFDENDKEGNVRAIIESRFLSMRLHSSWIGEHPSEIYATGGASANKQILQIASNIFKTPIRKFEITDSAALGAALRCVKSYCDSIDQEIAWNEIVEHFLKLQNIEIIRPDIRLGKMYDSMLTLYKKYEDFVIRNGKNPQHFQQKFIRKYFR